MYFERLKTLRIERNLLQRQVADYLGCQREVYRRYECGERTIPVDFVIALAALYKVTTDYLLNVN